MTVEIFGVKREKAIHRGLVCRFMGEKKRKVIFFLGLQYLADHVLMIPPKAVTGLKERQSHVGSWAHLKLVDSIIQLLLPTHQKTFYLFGNAVTWGQMLQL